MAGESALATLLGSLAPQLNPGTYVFCSLTADQAIEPQHIIGSIREAEGLSLILAQEQADRLGLGYDYVAAWISLSVHSALSAVGITAAFAGALAAAGISCNVVAGYYHDHLFVAAADAERAMAVLRQLAEGAA
ncbi:ACT domain-containing protein [Pseudomonas sp. R-28-1W-6]|uniref:ACT domain-containing protein n=1 Tax=Pseudomonas sp. R-28-1W-6 TaxID=2650101 RepID=UPI001365E1CC|nr:ACT domain-containing protein [Pseudomonas sp. R-28-1W-6]MWV12836.1 ACT domain-containing protein [Pseudomonas sp. R-28-1W-6]